MTTFTGSISVVAAGDKTGVSTKLATHSDALKALSEAWTSYTPTWTSAGTAPAIGNGILKGKWLRVNKLVHYRIQLTMGSTTTYGSANNWSFALPTAAHADYTANMHMGNGIGLDSSAPAFSTLTAGWLSSTTIFVLAGTGTTALQQSQPWAWANGDKVTISGTYETA